MPITPDDIRQRQFEVGRRGYDRDEVERFRAEVAETVEELSQTISGFEARLGQLGIDDVPDLGEELSRVAAEVGTILEDARRAATEMRRRAEEDATRWRADAERDAGASRLEAETEAAEWRSQAQAEATEQRSSAAADTERLRAEAQRQTEELRGSAWAAAAAMIERANADAAALVAEATQDALFIRAGAERDSLRLTGTARQDAEAEMKGARTEAERMVREAEQESGRLMEEGRLATEAAAEEVRVLDQQRIELLVDVEAMQRTIDQMDLQLEARLNPTPVVEDQPPAGWAPEPAVRVVPASRLLTPGPIDADELMAEVARLREESTAATPGASAPPDGRDGETPAAGEDDAEDAATDPPAEAASLSAEAAGPVEVSAGAEVIELARRGGEVIELPVPGEVPVDPAGAPAETVDRLEPGAVSEAAGPPTSALDDLFASLRISGEDTAVDVGESDGDLTTEGDSERVPAPTPEPAPPPAGDSPPAVDPAAAAELRARLLLPTENTALRTVKRGIVDLQNRVLAEIHDDPTGWSPDGAATGEAFAASMATLIEAAYAAGHEAAGELTGRPGPEP
ncbi:MAG TPA: DivIVA domain-containing protein, partial [Acidimicrobiia bacterium]